MPYQEFIKGLIEQFEEITFKHLPREENYLADALATLATMFKINANAEAQHEPIVPVFKKSQTETLGIMTF